MVNHPSSPPPPGHGPKPDESAGKVNPPPSKPDTQKTNEYFDKPHEWLGMQFSGKDWKKLMDQFVKNMGDYINKITQQAIQKMKENWRREQGDD